jgi:CheY-like chemotaxis protein
MISCCYSNYFALLGTLRPRLRYLITPSGMRISKRQPVHVLIIEDLPLIALDIQGVLQDLGYTSFAIATTQAEAVSAAVRQPPDLVTADYGLAQGDGVSAVKAICTTHPAPVVFITGSKGAVLSRLPAAVLVSKPYSNVDIARAVEQARTVRG